MAQMNSLSSTLKDLDIGLAYDDFGVGQTRLVELAKFPPDFLKFDISLIRRIHLAPKRLHQLVVTFLNMSQDLGAGTIAEGIECKEEGETCRQLGFDAFKAGRFDEAGQHFLEACRAWPGAIACPATRPGISTASLICRPSAVWNRT